MVKLNTLHDGAFTQYDPLKDAYLKIKEQGDIHVHHYQKGENPDDKKKKEKEAKANGNGNGNGSANGNGAPENGNGGPAAGPPPQEAAPPPPEDKGNPLAKFSKDEVKRIRQILKKEKTEKAPEKKLSSSKDKVKTKPSLKDTKVDEDAQHKVSEMSADLAYRAMDKADKKSRGEMSIMDPKRARKKARQARKFADYSIKKTLSKEEFEHVHKQALKENAKRDIMAFGAKLKGYSDRSGGIDKDYFNKIANTALSGRMPDKRDIDGDTDPRDFVLDMMNRTFPKATMQNYAGISPSFDQYLRSKDDIHESIEENVAYLKNKDGHVFHISKRDKKGDAFSMSVKDKSGKTIKDWGSHPSLSGAKKFASNRGFNEEVQLDEVESAYAKQIADYKARGGTVKKYTGPDMKRVKRATSGFKKKLAKTMKIHSDQDEKERSEREKNKEIDEARKSDYELYHKDFSSAMQHAYAVAKKRGYIVDPQEIDNKVATGPRKPSSGKTNRYILGTDKKQNLHVQVANLDNKRYELNMYIEEIIPEENTPMKTLDEGFTTMNPGAFTNDDPLKSVYIKMKMGKNEVDAHSGEENDNEEQLNEKEDITEHCGECGAMDHVDEASPEVKKRVGMFNRIKALRGKSDGKRWVKTDLANEAKKLDPVGKEDGDVDNDGDRDSSDKYLMKKRKAIGKAMKKEENIDEKSDRIKDDPCWKGYKMVGMKKKGGKEVPNCVPEETQHNEAYGDYDDDRAMAAQKAQMPASLGGKHKDRSRPKYTTQVTKQKSQYHAKEETEVNEISDRKIQKAIDKGHRIHGYAHDPKLGMGKADKAYGDKKKKQANRLDDKLSDRRDNRELKRHGRFLEPGEQGYSKARDDLGHKYRAREMKKEESEVNEISDRLAKRAINKAHAASRSADSRGDKKLSRKRANQRDNMTDMLADKQDRREYENMGKGSKRRETVAQMGRHYEGVSKNMSKLNKILENRKNIIADGQGGAGEQGTDELVNNYKKATPGQIAEGNITQDSGDDFKKFEHMVEYLMGISVKYPENFQIFEIEDTGKYRIEHEHGPIATICEVDVRNFMGPNVDMEMFIDMVRGFGLNVTTPEQSHVVGDRTADDQIVKKDGAVYNESVKRQTPQEYADEYSKRYGINGSMDQMRRNIEALAKRI